MNELLMSTAPLLEPLRFPLHGSRLIEASAGTGKTFTIAALYLRLVLGHGGSEHAYARALTPPEILVVTFTDAATKELRDRIRARLAEAAGYFLADPEQVQPQATGRDLLHDLRAEYPAAQWTHCARQLQLAAEWMDEAAVSTIHGWCNRMLREHAFDSDSLFTQRLETDQGELLGEMVRDYWRTFLYPLDAPAVAGVLQWWQTPEALQKDLRQLLSHREALGNGLAPAQAIAQAQAEADRVLGALKAPWAAWVDELQALLDDAVALKVVHGTKLQKRYYQPWLDKLREWAATPGIVQPDLKTGWQRLSPDGLAEVWKDGAPPDHPALHALAALPALIAQLPDARQDILRHATAWVAERFAAEQERRAQMGFDDLLTRLDAALQGPNGARLAELIRQQFPVALIDEFQDTDPLQYRIFDAIYRVAANDRATALILIGDPKQAIYAFRGADIHTYLAARRATEGRHYTLGTNFRSTSAMVGAVNHCFEQAERREEGHGAFLLRTALGNPLPFVAVAAQGRPERWVVQGVEASALTCWTLGHDDAGDVSRTAHVQGMGDACASEIVRLLRLGQTGRAGFAHADDSLQPLRPGDIAVLVNTGKEAAAVRQALAHGGVRSVYLSDKESVFQSPAADELQRWLAACAEPDDDRLLRAALGTPSLGMSWDALDELNRNELIWEDHVQQFRGYRQCWRRLGVLPMLRRLMGDFHVPRRLLSLGDERGLTDLLHLAELLQHASTTLDGEHALIRHLAEQREDTDTGNDQRKLRLESDADLVKVVTVHKSKGLEYPLVFLPFASSFRATTGDDLPLKWHDDEGRLLVALGADDAAVQCADRERLGEDLRKLYVALTRARHATWVGLAPLKDLACSAIGYLLGGGEPIAADQLPALALALKGERRDIAVLPAPEPDGQRFEALDDAVTLGPLRPLDLPQREPWWIASYSSLQFGLREAVDEASALPAPGPETAAEEIYAESIDEPRDGLEAWAAGREDHRADPLAAPAPGSLHAFPRGPNPGSFLHGLLEWAGEQGFDQVLAQPAEVQDLIARRCNLRGWSRWIEPLGAWLLQLLGTPLALPSPDVDAGTEGKPGTTVRLADLSGYQVEMEFWFSTRHVDTRQLDALVKRHTLDGAPRPSLLPHQLNGMLKGFIDLVFEHEGRYYVADYKSNWLGAGDAHYSVQAMQAVVLAKRYDLQFVLYLFALHRLLRARLPDYDYDRHVGGAVYLFLRGTASHSQGMLADRPPRALMDALDALFTDGRGPSAGASAPTTTSSGGGRA